MSKLMPWVHYCIKALKDLNDKKTKTDHYQLQGIPELNSMKQTILSWREHVIHSTFAPERKRFCLKIDGYLITAYTQASNRPTGPMSGLREPLLLLKMTLRQLMIIRDFDDRMPVQAAEAPRASRGAEDAWLTIVLQYTRACLLLLLRIFWLVMPEFPEWWEELENSLQHDDWLKQFIIDSRKSERLAVANRERLLIVLEEFRRQKRAIESGQGSQKELDLKMLV